MESREILKRIRHLIRHERNWVKCKYSVDRKGDAVSPTDAAAYRYCLKGAICAISHTGLYDDSTNDVIEKLNDILRSSGAEIASHVNLLTDVDIVVFNDYYETTHEHVLGLLDRAIEEACCAEK